MGVNPLSIMLPVTVSCSYAFMLPVSSGTNAIIFEVGRMKNKDMVSCSEVTFLYFINNVKQFFSFYLASS